MTLKLNIDKAFNNTVDRRPAGNSGLAKKQVQWLNEHSTSLHILWNVGKLVLRNPLLRKAAKRYCLILANSVFCFKIISFSS
jgi:hypothetical protein